MDLAWSYLALELLPYYELYNFMLDMFAVPNWAEVQKCDIDVWITDFFNFHTIVIYCH